MTKEIKDVKLVGFCMTCNQILVESEPMTQAEADEAMPTATKLAPLNMPKCKAGHADNSGDRDINTDYELKIIPA